MGGINPNEESMYPHFSRMYREGGFHYRTADGVGLYEELLRCMLTSVEGSRVRLLRYGNERITDEFLLSERVAPKNASADELRSIRRDMLTYAIDPMPTVFETLSDDNMENSFYALGTRMLNRMRPLNGRLLENPALESNMDDALDELIVVADDVAVGDDDAHGVDAGGQMLKGNAELLEIRNYLFASAGGINILFYSRIRNT